MLYIPVRYKYLASHIWFQEIGKKDIVIGISDFAQQKLGRIESIELGRKGKQLLVNEIFGKIYANNDVLTLRMPVNGKLLAFNHFTTKNSATINSDPYKNWIAIISSVEEISDSKIQYYDSMEYKEFISLQTMLNVNSNLG